MNERTKAVLILAAAAFVLLVLLMIMSGCAVARPPLETGATEPARGGRALLVVCFFSSCRDINEPRELGEGCVKP